jgi:hypothetical protein
VSKRRARRRVEIDGELGSSASRVWVEVGFGFGFEVEVEVAVG